MKKNMGFIISFLVLGLVVGALVYLSISGAKNKALVEEKLFSPYFAAISAGRYADAWAFYTPEHQKQYPLAEFEAHYRKTLADEGTIERRNVFAARGYADFQGNSGLNVTYQVYFKKDLITINYQVAKDPDGGFHIRTGKATSRNFVRYNLPW